MTFYLLTFNNFYPVNFKVYNEVNFKVCIELNMKVSRKQYSDQFLYTSHLRILLFIALAEVYC